MTRWWWHRMVRSCEMQKRVHGTCWWWCRVVGREEMHQSWWLIGGSVGWLGAGRCSNKSIQLEGFCLQVFWYCDTRCSGTTCMWYIYLHNQLPAIIHRFWSILSIFRANSTWWIFLDFPCEKFDIAIPDFMERHLCDIFTCTINFQQSYTDSEAFLWIYSIFQANSTWRIFFNFSCEIFYIAIPDIPEQQLCDIRTCMIDFQQSYTDSEVFLWIYSIFRANSTWWIFFEFPCEKNYIVIYDILERHLCDIFTCTINFQQLYTDSEAFVWIYSIFQGNSTWRIFFNFSCQIFYIAIPDILERLLCDIPTCMIDFQQSYTDSEVFLWIYSIFRGNSTWWIFFEFPREKNYIVIYDILEQHLCDICILMMDFQ